MGPLLTHVAFYVSDLEKSLSFYSLLGFSYAYDLKKEDGSLWLVYLHNDSRQFVELFPRAEPRQNPTEGSFFHFCLRVEDIRAFGERLLAAGVTLYRGAPVRNQPLTDPAKIPKIACGSYAFFIRDPDGNAIEIMEYTPESRQLRF